MGRVAPFVDVQVGTSDGHRLLLVGAVAGLAVAAMLAVVGLPGVDLHGPLHRAGVMDPFCGGTRALRLTARGDLAGAMWWNPLSPILAIGAVGFAMRTLVGYASGRWINVHVTWRHPAVRAALLFGLVLLEIRQQSMASVLQRPGY